MDVLNIPYQNYFDFVILKSVLGGIRGEGNVQKRALSQIYKSLKKGGELLLAENLAGSPVHQFLRKRFVPWGKRWRYLFFEEIIELLEIFSEVKYITAGFLGALGRNNFQRTVLGYLDQLLIEKLVPQKWRYIFIAWAKK
jgi:SAM-dependent methyltransferase